MAEAMAGLKSLLTVFGGRGHGAAVEKEAPLHVRLSEGRHPKTTPVKVASLLSLHTPTALSAETPGGQKIGLSCSVPSTKNSACDRVGASSNLPERKRK